MQASLIKMAFCFESQITSQNCIESVLAYCNRKEHVVVRTSLSQNADGCVKSEAKVALAKRTSNRLA